MARRVLLKADLSNSIYSIRRLYVTPQRAIPRDKDLIFGDTYLVASHAILEAYFEELGRRVVTASVWSYQRSGKVSSVLASLLDVHYGIRLGRLPAGEFAFSAPDEAVRSAVQWYIKRIGDNNGIKRANLFGLLLPLGFTANDFDDIWLSSMDSFGANRGDVAHGRSVNARQSSRVTLTQTGASTQIDLLPQAQARSRRRNPSWEVDSTLRQILTEAYAWDDKCLRML